MTNYISLFCHVLFCVLLLSHRGDLFCLIFCPLSCPLFCPLFCLLFCFLFSQVVLLCFLCGLFFLFILAPMILWSRSLP